MTKRQRDQHNNKYKKPASSFSPTAYLFSWVFDWVVHFLSVPLPFFARRDCLSASFLNNLHSFNQESANNEILPGVPPFACRFGSGCPQCSPNQEGCRCRACATVWAPGRLESNWHRRLRWNYQCCWADRQNPLLLPSRSLRFP